MHQSSTVVTSTPGIVSGPRRLLRMLGFGACMLLTIVAAAALPIWLLG